MDLSDRAHSPEEHPRRYDVVNRQVVERAPLTEIRLAPRELRSISKKAVAVAKTLLTNFGQQQPLLISEHDELVAGQEFLIAAQELGWSAINVVRTIDLTPDQLRLLRLALQKLPEMSVWDEDALRLELTELAELDFQVELEDISGFSTTEIDLIVDGASDPEGNDPADELPQALKGPAVTRTGDLWILGGTHRLYCGDARNPQTYAALMGGERAQLVFTDPPWNVPIAGHVSGLGQVKHGNFAMGCGEMSEEQFTAFLTAALGSMAACCTDGALVYVFMDRRHLLELQLAARALGLTTVDLCIWNKLAGGMGSFYRSQMEPVFVFKAGAGPHRNNIELGRHGRYRTNVWDYAGFASFGHGRKEALLAHPTVKRVVMVADAIKDCTRRGEIVLDGFAGSGTTLIAADKAGRIGYGVELDAVFCDTIIRRYEALTGKGAVHAETGLSFADTAARRKEPASDLVQMPAHATPPCPTETRTVSDRVSALPPVRVRRRPTWPGADA